MDFSKIIVILNILLLFFKNPPQNAYHSHSKSMKYFFQEDFTIFKIIIIFKFRK